MQNKQNMVIVTFADGSKESFPVGISLLELAGRYQDSYKHTIVAGKIDNDIKELNSKITRDCNVELLDLSSQDGMRIYRRSLSFVLIKAVYDLFPQRKVIIHHSISYGLYCEIKGDKELTKTEVKDIENRMRKLVKDQIPFIKKTIPIEEARSIFLTSGRMDRFHAVEHRMKPYVTMYNCGGLDDYFYGYMVPHTGYVKEFELEFYPPGLIIRYPTIFCNVEIPEFKPQSKLFAIFSEYKRWNRILGIENVGALNDIVKEGKINEIIRIGEALHEKKIAQIADMIAHSKSKKKVVLIAGPSSSGKTTFAQRLSVQLRVNGLKPVTISLDDYFHNREQTPLDENGEYDFEALEAIDIELFNSQLSLLIAYHEVEMPVYNFEKGAREPAGKRLKINEENVLIIEGIHGLNEKLTASIPHESKFKIYVSALTSMNIDDHNRIPTTDTRLVRRIVRDHWFRGTNAVNTIRRWPSVRRGEEKNIFPFQEEADVMFNSALIFELGILKTYAEPLLAEIDSSQAEYSEAKRLTEFLSYFLPIQSEEIPLNSIIREFIGGCCFYGNND
ncbi:MAG: nucleoside kinase [Acetivibrionales bacterium]|jgi:uridine kinase